MYSAYTVHIINLVVDLFAKVPPVDDTPVVYEFSFTYESFNLVWSEKTRKLFYLVWLSFCQKSSTAD